MEETRQLREINQEELEQILEQHELWLDSNGQVGQKADLSYINLERVDLSDVDLRNAYLRHARLYGVDFQGTDLQDADLALSDLQCANLQDAILENANLLGCDLQYINLQGAILKNADLFSCNLQGANLQHAYLEKAKLQDANLQDAYLQYANFKKADLKNANLSRVNLEYAILDDANFYMVNLVGANYKLEQFKYVKHAPLEPKLQNEVSEFKKQNANLEKQLTKARENNNIELIQELEKKLQESQHKEKHTQQQLSDLQQAYKLLEDKLEKRIDDVKTTLVMSLRTSRANMKYNQKSARFILKRAYCSFGILGGLIIILPILFYFIPIKQNSVIEIIGSFTIILYTAPILIALIVSITLLRHHKKLQDEVRHYADQQQRIELYSGLLEASQYAAATFQKEDGTQNQRAEELVEETFVKIRDRLLADEAPNQSSGNAINDENYSVDKLLDVLLQITESKKTQQ